MPPDYTTTTRSGIHVPTSANSGTDFAAGLLQMANELDSVDFIGSSGKSIINGVEQRTNTAYGTLPTPDQVTGLKVADGGLLMIAFKATWGSAVSAAGRAAIFIGANQLKMASGSNLSPVVQESSTFGTASMLLHSTPTGLATLDGSVAGGYGGDVTTGQILGGSSSSGGHIIVTDLPAGTYTVSVQFKSSSGLVSVSSRKLWAWTKF